jgi:hypothetical protein
MPSNTLNKLASQAIYSNLPTIKAARKKDKITLLKAIAIMNNRGSISSVQKARRALERAKKRAAIEVKEEAGGEIGKEDNSEAPRARAKAGGRAAKRVRFSRGTKRSK